MPRIHRREQAEIGGIETNVGGEITSMRALMERNRKER